MVIYMAHFNQNQVGQNYRDKKKTQEQNNILTQELDMGNIREQYLNGMWILIQNLDIRKISMINTWELSTFNKMADITRKNVLRCNFKHQKLKVGQIFGNNKNSYKYSYFL